MKKDGHLKTIISADAREGLEYTVKVLNSPAGNELRKIIKLWQESGPNTWKLFGEHPDLYGESQEAWRPSLIPTPKGCAHINLVANMGAEGVMETRGALGLRFKAVVLFNALIVNPLWEKLAGPCPRCGNYYIKKRASQKVYCSRRCGNAATAVISTRARNEKARQDKLLRSRAAIREWRKAGAPADWKHFVSGKHKAITPKFLTRAVGKGDLPDPMNENDMAPSKKQQKRREIQ